MSTPDPLTRLSAALSGRYAVERELGEGGMATVYLARDERHNRSVALKVLKPELAAVIGAERFLAEIRTTASLQHPHILPLHDSGEADGLLFYVMPYVDGESLRERLDRERQLPVDDAVRIATNVAEALDYAHRHGVIHRDIKPANILLQDGKPVISDFGIALAVSSGGEDRLTETGLSLGTPYYMSPEQATGDQPVDPTSDIYALGCVLYEMLTGEPPFTGRTPQAVLTRLLTQDATPPSTLRSTVSSDLDRTVIKALQRVPADRFKSGHALAAELSAPRTPSVDGARAWKAVAGVTGVVTLASFGIWAAGSSEDSSLPADPAQEEASAGQPTILVFPPMDATGSLDFASLPDRLTDGIRRSVTQTSVARLAPRVSAEESDPRALASWMSEADATHAVTGSVYLVGDSLRLTLEFLDQEGASVRLLDELAAHRSASDELIGLAADQAAAAVLDLTFLDGHEFRYWSLPKRAEAMRLYRQGSFAFVETRYREATDLLIEAIEIEPEWPRPYWVLWQTAGLAGRRGEVWPQYEEAFEALRGNLSDDERMFITWQRSPSWEERLDVARQRYRLADGGSTTGYGLAYPALALNHIDLAVEAIDRQDFEHLEVARWPLAWMVRSQIYHHAGDFERELATAREGRSLMPERFWFRFFESRALLALDQDESALATFAELVEIPTTAQDVDPTTETRRLWNALHEGTFEFRIHGSPELEERSLEIFSDWALGRSDLSQWQLAQTYYRLGRFDEAIPLLRDELANTAGVLRLPPGALLAISLHRVGDTEGADEIEASLTYPPETTNWRRHWLALAAAGRSDPERALEIFIRSFADGVPMYPGVEDFVHFRSEFEELREDVRFQRLVEPRPN